MRRPLTELVVSLLLTSILVIPASYAEEVISSPASLPPKFLPEKNYTPGFLPQPSLAQNPNGIYSKPSKDFPEYTLDIHRYKFYIYQKLLNFWEKETGYKCSTPVFYIRIGQKGDLQDVKVFEYQGDGLHEKETMTRLKSLFPVEAPPPNYPDIYLEFLMTDQLIQDIKLHHPNVEISFKNKIHNKCDTTRFCSNLTKKMQKAWIKQKPFIFKNDFATYRAIVNTQTIKVIFFYLADSSGNAAFNKGTDQALVEIEKHSPSIPVMHCSDQESPYDWVMGEFTFDGHLRY